MALKSNLSLKMAGLLALSTSTVALAHTYERCDPDGDHCVRVTGDHDGDKCWKQVHRQKTGSALGSP